MNLRKSVLLAAFLGSLIFAQAAAAQDWIYRVQQGDKLWDLCIEYTAKRGCWLELGRYNRVADDRALRPGSEIRIPVAWLLEVPLVGKVLSVSGDVTYQAIAGSEPVPVRAGQNLALGSLLVSRAGSATVTLGGRGDLLLRPNSVLRINAVSAGVSPGQRSELYLDEGEVQVEVKPESRSRFEVHTPSAIAAVRGTEYRVASVREDRSTRSEVLAGLVAVEAGSSLDVPAGYGVMARPGAPLGEPRKLLAPPEFATQRLDAPLPVTVHWTGNPRAVGWLVDVYAGGENGAPLETRRPTEPVLVFDSLEEGCYRLVARGIDEEGFNGLEGELPLCVLPPIIETEPPSPWGLLLWLVTAVVFLL